jgi:membrane-associated protease RseP (regulator of RpoE activity)
VARPSLIPRPDPERRERRVAGGLFFATCASVFTVNLFSWQPGSWADPASPIRAAVFTFTLMSILLAHELGHYAMARHHGFRLSLPLFLPFPWLVGTLGAVIRLREAPRTRAGLLEMGAAGPLAGLLVAAPMAVAWVLVAAPPTPTDIELSRPLLFWVVSLALTGVPPGAISTVDPLGFAAWIGCLVTAMNLLPFGQLDGGHVAAAMVPERARTIGWVVTGALLVMAFWWPTWAIWAAVLHLIGTRHPVEIRRDRRPPGPRAQRYAIGALMAFVLTFTPVPVSF